MADDKRGSARPNDLPIGGKAPENSTLASRAAAGKPAEVEEDEEVTSKRVAEASNKAVQSAQTKKA